MRLIQEWNECPVASSCYAPPIGEARSPTGIRTPREGKAWQASWWDEARFRRAPERLGQPSAMLLRGSFAPNPCRRPVVLTWDEVGVRTSATARHVQERRLHKTRRITRVGFDDAFEFTAR
jgi:hypothetical protein